MNDGLALLIAENAVRHAAKKLAPQLSDLLAWDENGLIRFDFAEQMGDVEGVSTFVAPFVHGKDDLECAVAIVIAQVFCWQLYGIPAVFLRAAMRGPTDLDAEMFLDPEMVEHFARVDRMAVTLLQNAGVENVRTRYAEYLGLGQTRQTSPAVLKSISGRQMRVLKPE